MNRRPFVQSEKILLHYQKNSVVILDNQQCLEKVTDDNFWINVTDEKLDYLRMYISPLMRVLSDADFKAMRFELDGIEVSDSTICLAMMRRFEIP